MQQLPDEEVLWEQQGIPHTVHFITYDLLYACQWVYAVRSGQT